MDLAARAIEAQDGRRLFNVIDERARHAMHSVVQDRRAAAALIAADYPQAERARAFSALGDAANVPDAAGLFAARCGAECMSQLRQKLGAPTSQRSAGEVVEVSTAQGGKVVMYRGSDTWWGIVWNTEALASERDRAAAQLRQIEENAAVYRRRRALEAAPAAAGAPVPSASGSSAEKSALGSSK